MKKNPMLWKNEKHRLLSEKKHGASEQHRWFSEKQRWLRLSKPLFFLVLSILLILLGIYREEAECVVEKATKICMECIGIG